MVFSSASFLYLFLPIFLICYFAARAVAWRNAVLLAFSLIFYAWGEPLYVALLLASIGVNWLVGLAIGQGRRFALAIGIALNLGVLAVAKYADMIAELLSATVLPAAEPVGLPLPLGISFFTFQAISYLVDVRRGAARAEMSLVRVALYIAMFPQLVAGPIVRYAGIAGQIARRRSTVWRAAIGTRIFAIGLAQKVLIANEAGVMADLAFALGPRLDASEAWLGLLCYTLQIYFDFAGYSNMAIGLGLVMGFTFPRNFDVPYAARSVTEFWRRWHISLSSWFRDYLYIPLGGSRSGPWRTYFNLWTVFLLCGLWHGAAWTFVAWGAWHGTLLVVERAFLGRVLAGFSSAICRVYLLVCVMLGWVLFRAETFPDAAAYYAALAGRGGNGAIDTEVAAVVTPYFAIVLGIGLVLALHRGRGRATSAIVLRLRALAGGWAPHASKFGRNSAAFAMLLLSMTSLAVGVHNPFLYFRF